MKKNIRRVVEYYSSELFNERAVSTVKVKNVDDVKEGDSIYVTSLGCIMYQTVQTIKEKINNNVFLLENDLCIQFKQHVVPADTYSSFFEKVVEEFDDVKSEELLTKDFYCEIEEKNA